MAGKGHLPLQYILAARVFANRRLVGRRVLHTQPHSRDTHTAAAAAAAAAQQHTHRLLGEDSTHTRSLASPGS